MIKMCHKSLVAIFLLVLLMSYKVGVTMFVHTHNVDGTMVAHSHPFTDSNHNHSSSQVLSIALLSSFNGTEQTINGEIKPCRVSVEEIDTNNKSLNVINAGRAILALRAPPVYC